jgi:hypothetical protein
MKGVDKLEEINVVQQIKYLGCKISLSKKQLINDAKQTAQKYMSFIRGRIQTNSEKLQKVIHGAFYKSLLIYFFTPLYAARIISRNEIEMFEASLIRKQLLLPNDIKSNVIGNISDMFVTPTDEIIHRLATK